MKVLLAGNDRRQLSEVKHALLAEGIAAEYVNTGIDCVNSLRNSRPDVLVIERDLMWGGLAGVRSVMRGDRLLAHVPIVVFTEDEACPEELGSLSDPPVVGWLKKGFCNRELICQIESARGAAWINHLYV